MKRIAKINPPLVSWKVVGKWYLGSAPSNGSGPRRSERLVTDYEVYSADYYGNGFKLYIRDDPRVEFASGYSSKLGGGNDGNLGRIEKAMAEAGVSLP